LKKGIDKSNKVRGVFVVHQNIPKRSLASHSHTDHHLFIPLQGSITIEIENGDVLKAGPGKMIYLPPNVEHQFTSSKDKGERIICNIDSKIWCKFSKKKIKKAFTLIQNQMIKEILFHLLECKDTKNLEPFVGALVIRLEQALEDYDELSAQSIEKIYSNAKDERLIKAIAIMNKKLSVNLPAIAKESGLSTRTMGKLFTNELNCSPKELQSLLRIEKAKSLLNIGKLSTLDVAFECGYNSYSQFFNQFKKITGKIPSDLN
tara:strand:+ start:77031 stop:77813 length:783 start_codon:yes stop_codon:yes gene_type:complete